MTGLEVCELVSVTMIFCPENFGPFSFSLFLFRFSMPMKTMSPVSRFYSFHDETALRTAPLLDLPKIILAYDVLTDRCHSEFTVGTG